MTKLVLVSFFYEHLGWGYLGLSRVIESFRKSAPPSHLTVESIEKKGNTEKFYFYLRHNKLKKANLDRAFGESRSGMIAHKNQKRITAGTQYKCKVSYYEISSAKGETYLSH